MPHSDLTPYHGGFVKTRKRFFGRFRVNDFISPSQSRNEPEVGLSESVQAALFWDALFTNQLFTLDLAVPIFRPGQ